MIEESNNNTNKAASPNMTNDKTFEGNSTNKNNTKNKKNKKKAKSNKKEKDDPKNNNKNEVKVEEKKEVKKKIIPEAKIVNELPKNDVIENKVQNVLYKIDLVYHDQDNILTVKPELKMINVFKKISKKLNVPLNELSLHYKEYEITEKYNDLTVKEFFNFPTNKARPIIYIKDKPIIKDNTNNNAISDFSVFYKRSYDNKIKITNYPSVTDINFTPNDDIYNVIKKFLKDTCITTDFTCERKEENKNKKEKSSDENMDSKTNDINDINNNSEENKTDSKITNNNNIAFYIGFPSPDIAFDFNRYMNSLRLVNPTFKKIKIQVLLSKKKSPKKVKQTNADQNDNTNMNYKMNYNYRYGSPLSFDEKDLEKRNFEILNVIRNNFLNNQMNGLIKGNNNYNYLSNSSPYSTPYEEKIKDIHENKKKWLNPRGFISSINKYSGIHI